MCLTVPTGAVDGTKPAPADVSLTCGGPRTMEALPAPFGWDAPYYASVTLTLAPGGMDLPLAVETLKEFSCYPPAIPKIMSCLQHSGRYDCYLQYLWFKHQHRECQEAMRRAGIILHIRYWSIAGRHYEKLPRN